MSVLLALILGGLSEGFVGQACQCDVRLRSGTGIESSLFKYISTCPLSRSLAPPPPSLPRTRARSPITPPARSPFIFLSCCTERFACSQRAVNRCRAVCWHRKEERRGCAKAMSGRKRSRRMDTCRGGWGGRAEEN
eukprot:769377-Rhodomonas_salina.2